jgi:hypothetical protein
MFTVVWLLAADAANRNEVCDGAASMTEDVQT